MIERILRKKIIDIPKSLILLGPRQVGKSTLCKSLPHDLYINLASQKTFSEHAKDPALLERVVKGSNAKTIFIDEIQRIPALLNAIQALIDDGGYRFYLSGSSARKLKRGQTNLLPGRVFVEYLPPLVYPEIEDNFDLRKALTIGTLPDVYLHDYGSKLLDSYADTYLREEIQAEALTKDLGAYARFLDLAAELSGQYLNYSKIASDAEINKVTIKRYFEILSDTFIVEKVASYSKVDKSRKARQKEKFIFFDMGVRNALLKRQNDTFSREELGSLFEQWFTLQAIYLNRLENLNYKISTYRDARGVEVDLILESRDRLYLIEIKSAKKIPTKQFQGLRNFEKITGRSATKIVVYQGDQVQSFGENATALPYGDLLKNFSNLEFFANS